MRLLALLRGIRSEKLSNGRDKNTGGMEKNIVKQETYLFYKDPIDVVEAFPL